jgi:hypothetical protein
MHRGIEPQIVGSSDTKTIGYFADVGNSTDANITASPQVKTSLFLVYQSHCSINRNRRRPRGFFIRPISASEIAAGILTGFRQK